MECTLVNKHLHTISFYFLHIYIQILIYAKVLNPLMKIHLLKYVKIHLTKINCCTFIITKNI